MPGSPTLLAEDVVAGSASSFQAWLSELAALIPAVLLKEMQLPTACSKWLSSWDLDTI